MDTADSEEFHSAPEDTPNSTASNDLPADSASAAKKGKKKGFQKVLHDRKMRQKYKTPLETSTADLKKRIRDAERLLKRGEGRLAADIQVELERRVKSLKSQLVGAEDGVVDREEMKRNYEKYKYVRFVGGLKLDAFLGFIEHSNSLLVCVCPLLDSFAGCRNSERQKVTRKLKQATKQLAASPDDPDLISAKRSLEVDLEYTVVGTFCCFVSA
jgi:hypothetical protein